MSSTISAGTTAGTAIAIAGDTSGQLVLQTNGTTTAVTISTGQVVTLAQPLPVGSGGSGVTTSTGSGAIVLGTSPTLSGTPLATTAANATNTTQIATTAFAYGAVSAAASGYTKLPNGLIIQWGTLTSASAHSLSITFPTACLTSFAVVNTNVGGAIGANQFYTTTTTSTITSPGWTSSQVYMAIGY